MVDEPGRAGTWILRLIVYGGAVAGLALVAAAAMSDNPEGWWLPVGVPLAVVCGTLALIWIRFRLRHRTPEARQRAYEALDAKQERVGQPLERSRLAYRATRYKKAVLRSGIDASAVVAFLADGGRANEFRQLVYLELDVRVPGEAPYQVRTGEFLNAASAGSVAPGKHLSVKVDPSDPQRVAVDWEQSLRLNDGGGIAHSTGD